MLEDFLSINDLQLCCCTWKPTGSTIGRIVILHGWLDQAMSWNRVAQRLITKGFEVYIYDHRGHGRSAHVSSASHYHFIDYVADLQSFMDKNIPKDNIPTTLVGHSMGGSIALIFAAAVSSKGLDRLVLIEGLGPPVESPTQALNRLRRHLRQRHTLSTHPVFSSPAQATERYLKRHPYLCEQEASFLTQRMLLQTKNGWFWSWDPRHRQSAALSYPESLRLSLIENITTPTSILLCHQSPYIKLPELNDRMSHFGIPIQQEYIDCGHSPHLEKPDLLSDWIVQIAART
ncbi:MAG: hypothetical protein CMK59_07480 [Proteobacteria bacterium]|nr:hypothetical protein [Pseudomonadota bacterium]